MKNNDNAEITLKLTFSEVNEIINSLSGRPFKDVYNLIGKIHSQSSGQVDSKSKSEA